MRKILVGTSWKMNKTVDESINYVKKLVRFVDDNLSESKYIDVFVIPTFLVLHSFSRFMGNTKLKYGAQNCFYKDEGAYTGEISPMHLKDIGCTYVELGHAERRNILKEDDGMINKKVIACLRNDLMPILCIGEEERCADIKKVKRFLKNQLFSDLNGVARNDIGKVVIAYEPIWAIGAECSAPIDYIYDMLGYLRELLAKEYGEEAGKDQIIFYGGSVNLESSAEILELTNNNGIFTGRAGLNFDFFTGMVKNALNVERNMREIEKNNKNR